MKATKSGKFINPTDQARKEARKRELRKVDYYFYSFVNLNLLMNYL